MDAILVGLEKTACLIDRCTIYELLYTNGDSAAYKESGETNSPALHGNLEVPCQSYQDVEWWVFSDKAVLPLVLFQYLRERFPTTSMRLSSWRKLLDRILLSPKLNALSSHAVEKHWHTELHR